MNEEALNMSLRKFLKIVGVTSQQEIEKAIRAAVADGRLKGNETIQAQMVLTIGKIGLNHKVDGEIDSASSTGAGGSSPSPRKKSRRILGRVRCPLQISLAPASTPPFSIPPPPSSHALFSFREPTFAYSSF